MHGIGAPIVNAALALVVKHGKKSQQQQQQQQLQHFICSFFTLNLYLRSFHPNRTCTQILSKICPFVIQYMLT